jgi:hypothetical protein
MHIIVVTQEAEIREIMVPSQSRQIVCKSQLKKKPSQKRAGIMAQGVGPEFKSQYYKKKILNENFGDTDTPSHSEKATWSTYSFTQAHRQETTRASIQCI